MELRNGFRIGDWDVFPLTGDIRSAGDSAHLEPKVMEVLVALARQAESVVLRDELLTAVWGERAAIADEPLTRCIAQLRQALGDASRDPKYIQTIPKRGYRLMQAVVPLQADAKANAESESSPAREPDEVQHHRTRSAVAPSRWQGWASIVGLVILAYFAYLLTGTRGSGPENLTIWSPLCDIEQTENPELDIPDRARELCEDGLEEMNRRGAVALYNAIRFFEAAIREAPQYGSAYVNIARAMVLYPTQERAADATDCAVQGRIDDPGDCFEAALAILYQGMREANYIEKYTHGIRAYVFTKQHEWLAAKVEFDLAISATPGDADMWQWYSQFSASVGNFDDSLEKVMQARRIDSRSFVILDRLVVVLMWLDELDQARLLAEERDQNPEYLPNQRYPESELVLKIRLGDWDALKDRLSDLARARRDEEDWWIDAFVQGIRDEAAREAAAEAVRFAIDNDYLYGQLAYGAWVYLEEADEAINAALALIETDPQSFDPEFLFTAETAVLRDSQRFGELVAELQLAEYWRRDDFCPPQLSPEQRQMWCED